MDCEGYWLVSDSILSEIISLIMLTLLVELVIRRVRQLHNKVAFMEDAGLGLDKRGHLLVRSNLHFVEQANMKQENERGESDQAHHHTQSNTLIKD